MQLTPSWRLGPVREGAVTPVFGEVKMQLACRLRGPLLGGAIGRDGSQVSGARRPSVHLRVCAQQQRGGLLSVRASPEQMLVRFDMCRAAEGAERLLGKDG